jgi:hypothetical protein
MSEPGGDPSSGISAGERLRLLERHPACRRPHLLDSRAWGCGGADIVGRYGSANALDFKLPNRLDGDGVFDRTWPSSPHLLVDILCGYLDPRVRVRS